MGEGRTVEGALSIVERVDVWCRLVPFCVVLRLLQDVMRERLNWIKLGTLGKVQASGRRGAH